MLLENKHNNKEMFVLEINDNRKFREQKFGHHN